MQLPRLDTHCAKKMQTTNLQDALEPSTHLADSCILGVSSLGWHEYPLRTSPPLSKLQAEFISCFWHC